MASDCSRRTHNLLTNGQTLEVRGAFFVRGRFLGLAVEPFAVSSTTDRDVGTSIPLLGACRVYPMAMCCPGFGPFAVNVESASAKVRPLSHGNRHVRTLVPPTNWVGDRNSGLPPHASSRSVRSAPTCKSESGQRPAPNPLLRNDIENNFTIVDSVIVVN